MASVRPVNSVGQWETRPAGTRPTGPDHPFYVGPPASVAAVGPFVGPPTGNLVLATPTRIVAQVRDGVAMFGTGAVSAARVPIMGANAPSAAAAASARLERQIAGASAQAMDLQHLPTSA